MTETHVQHFECVRRGLTRQDLFKMHGLDSVLWPVMSTQVEFGPNCVKFCFG